MRVQYRGGFAYISLPAPLDHKSFIRLIRPFCLHRYLPTPAISPDVPTPKRQISLRNEHRLGDTFEVLRSHIYKLRRFETFL